MITTAEYRAMLVRTKKPRYRNSKTLYVVSTVACFVRQGTNPTALSDGTDQYLPANVPMRLTGFTGGSPGR